MARVWSTDFDNSVTKLNFESNCEEWYGHKCPCCNSDRTIVLSKASRRGYLIQCQSCKNLYYVQEKK